MSILSHKNLYALTDIAIIQELGNNLKQMRLNANMSQQELAEIAGLDRITISKMENGRPITMITLVQVLRALQKLDVLACFYPESMISPLMLAAQEESLRKRASGKHKKNSKSESTW